MKCLLIFFTAFTAVFAVEITTPRPSFECTKLNCIINFAKMDDETFNEMIPEELSGILALKFSSCQIETIPANVFVKLPSLLCLMATTPGISSIEPETFLAASNLQFLYLPGNQIKKLNPKSFTGASNLNEINLTDNEIEVLSENAFESLEHLESLSLARNQISFFGQKTFSHLTGLMNLDISGNLIEFLDSRLFMNNEKLNGINIADNQIVAITNGFLDLLPQIKVLNIMNNPCTNNTMLENIPLIKIIDSKDLNSEDESSLENCYQNYIEMADPESTDLNNLLNQAEIVREDIETNLIAELNEALREKDEKIERIERRFSAILIFSGLIFFFLMFYISMTNIFRVVDNTFKNKLQDKVLDNVKIEDVSTEQIVYTIQLEREKLKNIKNCLIKS